MLRFIVRRVALGIFVLWAVATATFASIYSIGDPVSAALEAAGASRSEIARVVHELGYDRPFWIQYLDFLSHAVRGDFGTSFQYGVSSSSLIASRATATLELAGAAVLLTILVSVPLGVLAASRNRKLPDRVTLFFASVGQAVPTFVIGPLLILLFGVTFHMVTIGGTGGLSALILPAVTLSVHPVARIVRVLRGSMLETSTMDYVRTARAKGVSGVAVALRHVLRNALLPVVTLIGLELTSLIGGAVVVENIFGWQGIGTLTRTSLSASDYELAEGCIFYIAASVVLVNVVTDIVYSLVDPRVTLK